MAPTTLQEEDHVRDAAFKKALHGDSAASKSAFVAMLSKDSKSQEVAADAYFKHWDNKDARIETEQDREVNGGIARAASLRLTPRSDSEGRLCQSHEKVSCHWLPLSRVKLMSVGCTHG